MTPSLSLSVSPQKDIFWLHCSFLGSSSSPCLRLGNGGCSYRQANKEKPRNKLFSISCASPKTVRSPPLDKHVVMQNRTRFVQKLKTLLLSKPKHYIPIHILSKCRSYLSLEKPKSIRSMIHRYPSIFELITIPMPPTPLNATKSGYQLCVRLTPTAEALARQEIELKSAAMSITLANKLQKLLMLSSHRRLLLSKLVHLAPDLGLLPNFRSRLCNDFPDRFKVVDTSYGRALELVSWDPQLAVPLPRAEVNSLGLIVDRPLKFKPLKLRKGLNLKRRHRNFLIKFQELPNVCPYNTLVEEFAKESLEAEKRACGVVREVLGMTVEKRTLIDHLTHFRKEFGLSNKLRAMILRHPELFYVSPKGIRDSVLLVEGFDEKGVLLDKDETLVIKEKLMELVREGKRMRRERRKLSIYGDSIDECSDGGDEDEEIDDHVLDDYDYDDFENLFESADSDVEYDFDDDGSSKLLNHRDNGELWTAEASSVLVNKDGQCIEPW